MGRFTYEKNFSLEIEDRPLVHVETAIETKLRRGEPFMFTWKVDMAAGSGRNSVWVNRNSMLVFKYRTPQREINGAWVNALLATANSPTGMHIVKEPAGLPSA
ncbi:ATP-dependent DNA ligase [Microbacterium sp. EYE_5]|uniref:DUF7882 family protein n=1 Tax=unclassified Microbacterium TaxID=2609290 RepID=UPI0020044085|nr:MULTISPECIES: ATP-dependent DNA ligase [unclassified Microbacterium]MCK6079404.1 ATP-dependent DNA ligase [Microbacterium sp. EYE_382]MCK6084674.1 ATP-dependent DNA ligase [Microbacterium sp. EYE_384]MCK6123097.1 ATP-dependent DNA ligase [Microbacterium sp. EYE_80]MCK6125438.1 ATP-dependent DNA ligase [Microbacterium sp. EYE_79]MCK6140358.1 ATP-dependent DNA ligase [Microbacterium sp. EYE_39]